MKLIKLINMQECGALNCQCNEVTGQITIGGMVVTSEQCEQYAKNVGWLKWDKKTWEVIEKTNRFIRSIKSYIDDEQILNHTEITFQNSRRMNTEKYTDRIKLVNPNFDITIIYGAAEYGRGGQYEVYTASNNYNYPVHTCRTAKQLATYINSLNEEDDD